MGSVNFNRNEAEALPLPADKAPAAEKTAAPKSDKAAPVDDKDYSDMTEDGFVVYTYKTELAETVRNVQKR